MSAAFIVSASRGFLTASPSRSAFTPLSAKRRMSPAPSPSPRRPPRMTDDAPPPPTSTTTDTEANPVSAPSLDTTVFSDFVESSQAKLQSLQQKLQDVDPEELSGTIVSTGSDVGKTLIDNLLAGDWLNRGELYGVIQLVFVYLLLRGPHSFDSIVTFLSGPILLFIGAVVSGKGLVDLGRRQLSIWPAPVPNSELKTDGMYKFVRHPIYSGVLLASAGYAVATASPSRLALTAAFAFFLAKKIAVEEKFLEDVYPEYDGYCAEVPYKVLPKIY